MITWSKFTPLTTQTLTANDIGDGDTSGVWKGLEVDATNLTGTFTVTLPLASKATGRVITVHTTNGSNRTITIVPSGSDVIRDGASDKTTLSTTTDKTQVNLACDGTHWMTLTNDGNWS